MERGIEYYNGDIVSSFIDIPEAEECQKTCRDSTDAEYFTWHHYFSPEHAATCFCQKKGKD